MREPRLYTPGADHSAPPSTFTRSPRPAARWSSGQPRNMHPAHVARQRGLHAGQSAPRSDAMPARQPRPMLRHRRIDTEVPATWPRVRKPELLVSPPRIPRLSILAQSPVTVRCRGRVGRVLKPKCCDITVPGEGFEPPTFGLQNRCTTTVLTRQFNDLGGVSVERRQLSFRRARSSRPGWSWQTHHSAGSRGAGPHVPRDRHAALLPGLGQFMHRPEVYPESRAGAKEARQPRRRVRRHRPPLTIAPMRVGGTRQAMASAFTESPSGFRNASASTSPR